ncbi:MAG: hypothetical protein QJR07_14585 [Acetobacteraceae bacterium]|nr:hypothetical protein [Acetobacteraceae bacterium]
MIRPGWNIDLSRLWDVCLGIGTAAYFLGFFALIAIALRKLAY